MSAAATLFPETRGLPERGLGGSMSWGRGTRVPLARPKTLERGNSERGREGCDTKPLYRKQSKAQAGVEQPGGKYPPGKPHPKESHTAVK